MFKRNSGIGNLQDMLNKGQSALRAIRQAPAPLSQPVPSLQSSHGQGATAVLDEDPVPSPNTPPGAVDGIPQFSPSAKPAPDAPNFPISNNASVYERICAEWAKIAHPETGFDYFCEKYVWINNQLHGYMHFKLYEYQRRAAKMLRGNRFVITKKFRQAGMSLLTGVYCLWYSLTHPRMQCMVISIGQREATKYLQENVKDIWDALPKFLKGGLDDHGKPIKWDREKSLKDSASELWLPNRSKIRSIPSSKASGRSFTTKILVVDEAAFIEKIEEIWTGIFPTISNSGGSVFVVSTVNGVGGTGGWYYHKYKGAMAGENDFVVATMEYTDHPDYCDPVWAASMLRQLGQRKWDQEVLGKFLASGNTFIGSEHIEVMEHKADDLAKTCAPRMEHGGKLLIWKDFIGPRPQVDKDGKEVKDEMGRTIIIPAHRYAIGADCATAGGLDNSTFHVIDVTASEQVAELLPFLHRFVETGYLGEQDDD